VTALAALVLAAATGAAPAFDEDVALAIRARP